MSRDSDTDVYGKKKNDRWFDKNQFKIIKEDSRNKSLSHNQIRKNIEAADNSSYVYELKEEKDFEDYRDCKVPFMLLMDSGKRDPTFKWKKAFEF